ncbi:hypothetical protein ACH5RR_014094 [Cinchona calisaya]|uniref:LOB domain-containing protein n=1 Tax=Cinchona calisaya TaxID=153742 RepID=A0ABD3A5K3_9GENT
MSTSYSPCAACKCLRRKCTQECVFAPHFPPNQIQKFINVHKVFGASNIAKLLLELNPAQRKEAVKSLAFEADYRIQDPVYGPVGLISMLQLKLREIQHDLFIAKQELATYIGPSAMLPLVQHQSFMQQHPNKLTASALIPRTQQPKVDLVPRGRLAPYGGPLTIREPQQQQQLQQQQMYEAQQFAAAVAAGEQQEMFRTYQPQQQQQFAATVASGEQQEMFRTFELQQQQQQFAPSVAAREQQEIFRTHEPQQPQNQQQFAATVAAREQQEMFRIYEPQQPQNQQQFAATVAAREQQEMFRTYEPQPQQFAAAFAATEEQDMFRLNEPQPQQFAAGVSAREQQEMFRAYEPQQQQTQELTSFDSGFDAAGLASETDFNPMAGAAMSPTLALGSYETIPYDQISQQQQLPLPESSHSYDHPNQFQLQSQLMLQQQQLQPEQPHLPQVVEQQQPHGAQNEEGRSIGPSC